MPAKKTPAKKAAKKQAGPLKEKGKPGRPSKFSEAVAAEICERISEGIPMAVICRDSHMPHVTTVDDWAKRHPEFSLSIARARQDGGHYIADRARATARGKGDSTGDVQRDKLIVDTDLKLLAKWFPKDYGDKITADLNHTGEVRIVIGGEIE